MKSNKILPHSLFTEYDISLFQSGKHYRLYEKMGSSQQEKDGVKGTYFAVYAPGAKRVSVVGNFNFWDPDEADLNVRWDGSGIWEGFYPGLPAGELYKYRIESNHTDEILEKADPFGRFSETRPKTASISWESGYKWHDGDWMNSRGEANSIHSPFSVYELHLGSWRRHTEENRPMTYSELADALVSYVADMGFTHVELMPVMEHPYDPSWGYQITGYFAPTSRFGNPDDFRYLVDRFHQAGVGVILDWVPSHFPEDKHGLAKFDGSNVYEHPDKRLGYHPDWESMIFNYGRPEVRSFLISNALYWLDEFHIDGLRVDAVASMIYLDYSREEGQWVPNRFGEREYIEAIELLQEMNKAVYEYYPDCQTIAEESTAFPNVSRPTYIGGLGFGMKWMMGWMHDTLEYFKKDPIHRRYHHNEISFSLTYAFTENFMLPLSHDEVVYGKNSLIGRMPGDEWQRFANLRLLFSYMYCHPGAKLLFMGGEFGQYAEWDFKGSLDWHLLQYDAHAGVRTMVRDLNHLYRKEKALYELSFTVEGFEWIHSDHDQCVISFVRKDKHGNLLVVVCNFTPVVRYHYEVGVPEQARWKEIFNSDNENYWGSGVGNTQQIESVEEEKHGRQYLIRLTLPPLATIIIKKQNKSRKGRGKKKAPTR